MSVLEIATRRAAAVSFAPASFDPAAGTVQAVIATDSLVPRGGISERLILTPDSVTVAESVVVLDSHRQTSIADIKGRASKFRFASGELHAELQLTDEAAREAVANGTVTAVSIGYRILQFKDSRDPRTGLLVRTVTKLEIVEVSLVAVPADTNATIRSHSMEEDEVIEAGMADTISDQPENATRAETNAQIRSAVSFARLPATFADGLIDREATVDEARSAVLAEMQRRSVNVTTVRVGPSGDDPAVVQERMAEALACRAMGTAPSDAARQYMGLTFTGAARLFCRQAGISGVDRMGNEEVLTRAMQGTDDYSALFNDTGSRVLMAGYRIAESPVKTQLARQTTATDFRAKTALRFGGFPTLKEVTEHGEITSVAAVDEKESYRLKTYAATTSFSRKALINDDLGALQRVFGELGRSAAKTEADQIVSLLVGPLGVGPAMEDGNPLFHSSHGNFAAVAAPPSVETVSDARLALRRQTGLDLVTPISATPKFLLVPPELETVGEQLLTQLAAATVDDANPFSGRLTLLVEPRLASPAWYVFADPAVLPVLEYAYLSSAQGPQLASRDGWDVLGREFRVVLDFGCGAVDYRGAYLNEGDAS